MLTIGNMRFLALLFALALAAPPATAADQPMTAEAFDDYVTGRTITFRTAITPQYGVERYLQGRRVMWSALDGTCQYGIWFESKGDICFRYENNPERQCWRVFLEPEGLRGVFTSRPPYTEIFEVTDNDAPLICNDLSS